MSLIHVLKIPVKAGTAEKCVIIAKKFFDKYADLQFDEFSKIICSFLVKDFETQIEVDKILNVKRESSFVSRMSTGLAAENYFMSNYEKQF